MATKTRIYLVKVNSSGETTERLVRASSQAQASAHVTKDLIECAVAESDDLYRLGRAAVDIEDADQSAAVEE